MACDLVKSKPELNSYYFNISITAQKIGIFILVADQTSILSSAPSNTPQSGHSENDIGISCMANEILPQHKAVFSEIDKEDMVTISKKDPVNTASKTVTLNANYVLQRDSESNLISCILMPNESRMFTVVHVSQITQAAGSSGSSPNVTDAAIDQGTKTTIIPATGIGYTS